MKVADVEIFDVRAEWFPRWNPVLIRVNTDEGISGLGEVGLAFGTGHDAGLGMVKNLIENFLIGSDPFRIEKTWETMFRSSFWALGGGPAVYGGMSAIDIALWDIKAKALGVPVYQLLGGKTNDRIRAYASQIQFGWGDFKPAVSPGEYAEQARNAIAEGYTAVKVNPMMFDDRGQWGGWSNLRNIIPNHIMKLIYDRMEAIREAVGPDVDILLEVHALPSVTTAIQIGKALEEFKPMYYEESVKPLNASDMAKVAGNVSIPIATGERIYTRWGFREFFEQQVVDVIQPDLCLVGGITEGKKICDMANTYDVTVQCHVCGGPVTTAAAVHVEAAIPNFIIHEHVGQATMKGNQELVRQEMQPVKGYFDVPDTPGLGIELDDKIIAKYPCIKVS